MTQTLAVDDDNDIYINADGNIAFAFDLQATLQACEQAAKTILGEMVLAVDQGIPDFQVIWVGTPNIPQFQAALRLSFLNVIGVTSVESLLIKISNNILSYTAVIVTQYGTGTING